MRAGLARRGTGRTTAYRPSGTPVATHDGPPLPWSLAGRDQAAADEDDPCAGLGHDRARWARLQSSLLGGGDHLAPDRALAEQLMAVDPLTVAMARSSRAFAAASAADFARQGIDQYLVLGCGYPMPASTPVHDVVLAHQPAARIVYSDADVSVMAHARALLTAPAPAAIRYLHVDLTVPDSLASSLRSLSVLDLDRPVALILADVLQQLTDEQAHQAVALLHGLVSVGSVLTVSHQTLDRANVPIGRELELTYRSAGIAYYPRTGASLASLLSDWQLQRTGITELDLLSHAEVGRATPHGASSYGATARKGVPVTSVPTGWGPQ
ncbi:SAM-dependent methyltransferase [Kitasatospora sp. NPDC059973]|uniref:SAM-dependent methyltransferase n=1 Tax=Kitasatospora sp. NPDC059973 TaxID=3347020 RepID=UPI003686E91A